MKEALGSSKTSVLTRATQRNVPEDAILHSHRRENLKSYISIAVFRILKQNVLFTLFSITMNCHNDLCSSTWLNMNDKGQITALVKET
jgi:hypothetical protein